MWVLSANPSIYLLILDRRLPGFKAHHVQIQVNAQVSHSGALKAQLSHKPQQLRRKSMALAT